MPIGPGGLDPNGIWQFGEDDSEALASDLLNLGMSSVSTAIGSLPAPADPAILQVLSSIKTDTFSSTSVSPVDVTGLSVDITPSSSSNKILIMAKVTLGGEDSGFARLSGGNADTFIGDAAGSRTRTSIGTGKQSGDFNIRPGIFDGTIVYLDSPATTSTVTYKVQIESGNAGDSVTLNYSFGEGTDARYGRYASSITVMEVAG